MTRPEPIPYGSTHGAGVHVLYLSTNPANLIRLRSILGSTNWRWTEALTMPQLRAVLRSSPPVSVVICDRNLTTAPWIAAMRAIHELPNRPAFVVAADSTETTFWAEALHLGADDVLATPFEGEETRWVVSHHHLMKLQRDGTRTVDHAGAA